MSDGRLELFGQSVPLAEGGSYAPLASLDRDALAGAAVPISAKCPMRAAAPATVTGACTFTARTTAGARTLTQWPASGHALGDP